MMLLCICCAYLPDLDAKPLPCRLPVDFETGEVDFSVLKALTALDPIQRISNPEERVGLAGLDLLFIDAGRFDEYNLQIAARRFVAQLEHHGIPHVHEEFDGGHRGMAWRYGVSLSMIAEALK